MLPFNLSLTLFKIPSTTKFCTAVIILIKDNRLMVKNARRTSRLNKTHQCYTNKTTSGN